MRQFLTYGSVRGAARKGRPYRDPTTLQFSWSLTGDCPDVCGAMRVTFGHRNVHTPKNGPRPAQRQGGLPRAETALPA